MSIGFTESVVEDAALAWLGALGYTVLHGPDVASGEPGAERSDPNYRDVLLEKRLRQALVRLNPTFRPKRWRMPTANSRAWTRRRSWSAIALCTGCWSMA